MPFSAFLGQLTVYLTFLDHSTLETNVGPFYSILKKPIKERRKGRSRTGIGFAIYSCMRQPSTLAPETTRMKFALYSSRTCSFQTFYTPSLGDAQIHAVTVSGSSAWVEDKSGDRLGPCEGPVLRTWDLDLPNGDTFELSLLSI